MGALDWFSQLSPEMQAALVQGGFQLGGGILEGQGEQGRSEAQNAANLRISQTNNLTDLARNESSGQQSAVNSMGSPLKFARERAGMAFLGDMLGNGGGSASQQVFAPPNIAPYQGRVGGGGSLGSIGSTARQFLTPEAMANAEVPYWQGIAALNPDVNPNLSASGYGAGASTPGTGASQSPTDMIDAVRQKQGIIADQRRTAVNNALGVGMAQGGMGGTGTGNGIDNWQPGMPIPKGYHEHKGKLSKDGSGFWHKLGKIGSIIGGGALMATGIGGPVGAALIGAGTGALSGAIDNGWKGALTGGALGGLTGGFGGTANAAKQGFGSAVKSMITNPRFLTNAVGQGIGGKTGAALQLGSMAMPALQGPTGYVQNDINSVENRIQQAGRNTPPWQDEIRRIISGALGGQRPGNVPVASDQTRRTGIPGTMGGGIGGGLLSNGGGAGQEQLIAMIMSLLQQGGGGGAFAPQNPVGGINYGGASTPPFQLYPQVQR